MKQFAARDFEDVLQCIIPVIEGLIPPPYGEEILDLLFITCWLHGLSKLHLHTDQTLQVLETVTAEFGRLMRVFSTSTCTNFATSELPRETAARLRRNAKLAATKAGTASLHLPTPSAVLPVPLGSVIPVLDKKKPVTFNMATYKHHAIGDYARTIREHGTTDSFSTQSVGSIYLVWYLILIISFRERGNTVSQKAGCREQT